MKIHTKVVISLAVLMVAGCASTSKEDSKLTAKIESTPQSSKQESHGEGARAVLEYKRLGLRLIHSQTIARTNYNRYI